MEKLFISFILFAALGFAQMAPAFAGIDHIVGRSLGWRFPPNVTYYQDWAKPRTFGLGDKLVFPFRTGVHNLIEVSKEDFDACTQKKVVHMLYKGPIVLELNELGEHYYYCGVGTHCELGQKLSINVVNATGSAGPEFETVAAASAPTESKSSAHTVGKCITIGGLLSLLVSAFFIM
ncbi:hypothetical protein C5167_015403 [Papaver somniferum]|uniref:Phytocyanin domain-containing protein n=1 Tax=Papaver somniferum TaxID=3469 RepID=A0A4Y7J5Y3_PAPSO|nr:umecyanin-like [Papaver somniferum]RZC56553.1 hypothetical protein C5167_015403 [Papaver somniferum]